MTLRLISEFVATKCVSNKTSIYVKCLPRLPLSPLLFAALFGAARVDEAGDWIRENKMAIMKS
jgi:hypothetical protein